MASATLAPAASPARFRSDVDAVELDAHHGMLSAHATQSIVRRPIDASSEMIVVEFTSRWAGSLCRPLDAYAQRHASRAPICARR